MSPRTALTLTDAVAASLREACAQDMSFADRMRCGHEAITAAVSKGLDLDAMWLESDADKRLRGAYRRHQVVTDEEFGFTIVVLLWESGAFTPIHDHDTWCVFGVLQGELEVTNYEIADLDDERGVIHLKEGTRDRLAAFSTGDNLVASTEIHRVRNIGDKRAVSLHVYGSDLSKRIFFGGRRIFIQGKEACMAFPAQPAY